MIQIKPTLNCKVTPVDKHKNNWQIQTLKKDEKCKSTFSKNRFQLTFLLGEVCRQTWDLKYLQTNKEEDIIYFNQKMFALFNRHFVWDSHDVTGSYNSDHVSIDNSWRNQQDNFLSSSIMAIKFAWESLNEKRRGGPWPAILRFLILK